MFRCVLSAILLLVSVAATDAQSVTTNAVEQDTIPEVHKESFGKRLNKTLTNSYFKERYDTAYVVRPHEKWLFRLMVNQTGNRIHAKGTINDVWSKYDLHTKRNTTLSLEVNYCDIAAALSINPSKMRGDNDDYELNFEYHGQKFSIDFNYQRAYSLAGHIHLGDIDHLNEDGLRMNVVNLAGYYTFNYRRFSFPAALYQNFYQRRSAGSWLAGFSYQGGSIKTTKELKLRSPESPIVHLNTTNISLGGGYGYNWVLGRRSQWLLHISALPTFVVFKHNKLTVNDERIKDKRFSFNMIFNERASVVYHFSPRYNIGASFIMSNSIFDNRKVAVNQNKWLTRVFLGYRL